MSTTLQEQPAFPLDTPVVLLRSFQNSAPHFIRPTSVQFKDIPPVSEGKEVKMERLQFELSLPSGKEVDLRTKAMLIIRKLIHVDPSCKVMPYKTEDSVAHPILNNHYEVPMDLEPMKIYIAHPQHNPKTRRSCFTLSSLPQF